MAGEPSPEREQAAGEQPQREPRAAELCGLTPDRPVYGGQAVIEGVMMRSPNYVSVAVRREDGEIVVRTERVRFLVNRYPWLNKFLLRGVFVLFDTLVLGLRALMFSSNVAIEEAQAQESRRLAEDEVAVEPTADGRGAVAVHKATGLRAESTREKTFAENKKRALRILAGKVARAERAADEGQGEGEQPQPKHDTLTTGALAATMAVAFAVGIAFFVILPNVLAGWLEGRALLGGLAQDAGLARRVWLNIVEGAIRLAFFLAYLAGIGLMPDIRRVFQYHGAEHKVVHAVEAGRPLTVEAVRDFSPAHPRCGTNFVVIVICVSILVFSLFEWDNVVQRIVVRLATLPVVVAVSYELLKLGGRFKNAALARLASAPGLFVQKLTTRQPDDAQLEVAIRAMEEVIRAEQQDVTGHARQTC